MAKIRLDALLVDRKLAENKTRAAAEIMAGNVYSGERRLDKPGSMVQPDVSITMRGQGERFASRGAFKLKAALETFDLDPSGITAIDIGASTGGFTDLLLKRGAEHVIALDVGHGQLDWKLRNDPRVTCLEKTNARHLTEEVIEHRTFSWIVTDVSFISLTVALPPALDLCSKGGVLAALIKPQFEAGRDQIGSGGVVRDPEVHTAVCDRIESWLSDDMGWSVRGIVDSPITGPKGNREFMIVADKP